VGRLMQLNSMDFSLPRLFVVPSPNTIPTTGTTQNLTPNQFGVFLPNYTPAAAGPSAAANYIFLAQGSQDAPNNPLNLPSKKGDKIAKSELLDFYVSTGTATGNVQIS